MTAETAGPPDSRADARTAPTAPDVTGRSPAFADGLWVDRIGSRRYLGHNTRGAQVLVGPAEAGAVFTPGELMKIALAGCSGMSAEDRSRVETVIRRAVDRSCTVGRTLQQSAAVSLTVSSRDDSGSAAQDAATSGPTPTAVATLPVSDDAVRA